MTSFIDRSYRHFRRRFVDGPRGFGHPVPAAAFDAEFRSGHWSLLDSFDEKNRYETLRKLILRQHPRPRLLDAGCGGGRLGASFASEELTSYHGVDLSTEAIARAREHSPQGSLLEQADLETWAPVCRYDVIVINEVMGYLHDPAFTLGRLAAALEPGGVLIVSLYRWGNSKAIWQRVDRQFRSLDANVVTNTAGDKVWDIRVLAPISAPHL